MFKRVMIIGLITITAFLMLGMEAKAQGVWNVHFFWGSIDCASILNGISKKLAPTLLVECKIRVTAATLICKNPAGNADSSGSHNFQPQSAVVTALTLVTACQLDKQTGKWHCDQTIPDAQILSALQQDPSFPSPADICPNANWIIELGVVAEMDGKVTVFSCKDAQGNACSPGSQGCLCTTIEDAFCADCSIPSTVDVAQEYSCTELALAQCPVP